jgi:predicted GIY-YIG superfamily endonuclease
MSDRRPHYLYRCFDADDFLIYIGCTVDVRKRLQLHRCSTTVKASRWLTACMARHIVSEPYPSRVAALAAEAAAIAAEQPIFNSQERREPMWMTHRWIGQYLVQRGHLELAKETACTCWPEDREAGIPAEWCAPCNAPLSSGRTSPAAGRYSEAAVRKGSQAVASGTTPAGGESHA